MIIYTDGSCQKNPGPGGFGVVVLDNDENLITTYQERENNTTNNREELKAILWAFLKYAEPKGDGENALIVYSDSAYCINIFTNWIFNWKKNNWTRKGNKPIENLELIKDIDSAIEDAKKKDIKVEFIKVSGHSGNKWNEYVDKLAVKAKESCE